MPTAGVPVAPVPAAEAPFQPTPSVRTDPASSRAGWPGWFKAAVVAVTAVALLVGGGWIYVLTRTPEAGAATPGPSSSSEELPTSSSGNDGAVSADRPAVVTSTVLQTVVSTATVTAQPSTPVSAPTTRTTTHTTTTTSKAPDPMGGTRRDLACNSGYFVQLLSELTAADFKAHVAASRKIGQVPADAHWTDTGSGCALFSASASLLYAGTYPNPYDGCAARLSGPADAFIRTTDPTDKSRYISCLCPADVGSLPRLDSMSAQPQWTGEVQRALQSKLGYTVPELERPAAWGVYGPDTAAAVTRFQSENGLATTGQVDEPTWAALQGILC